MFRKVILSGAAVLLLAGQADAASDKQCQDYANDALIQVQMTKVNAGCGIKTSNRWHTNWKRHYDWCRTATTKQLSVELIKRENHLIACGAVQDGMDPIEEEYRN